MWNTILFDLDGTLTASAEGITKSVQYALQKMGKVCEDPQELMSFVGPPLREQFMSYAGFSQEEAELAVTYYRERYGEKGIFENRPFPGIVTMLQQLQEKGYILAVASSKPTYYIRKILEEYHMSSFFQAVCGSEMDGKRTDKSEVIEEALHQLGKLDARDQVLMVGDKSHDVIGAHEQQLSCVGVTFGYGGRKELTDAGADWIVDSVDELCHLLLFASSDCRSAEHPLGNQVVQDFVLKKIWRSVYPIGIHFTGAMVSSISASVILTVVYLAGYQWGSLSYFDAIERSAMAMNALGNVLAIPFLIWCLAADETRRGLWKQKKPAISFATIACTCFFAAAFGQIVSIGISILGLERLFPGYGEQVDMLMMDQPFWLILLTVGILAPIAEELTFRALIYRRIREYANVKWGILISSLLFGLYHGNVIQFVYATIMGAVFAWLYEKTGRLLIPILAHMAVNSWSVILSELVGETLDGTWVILFGLLMVAELCFSFVGIRYFIAYRWNKE
ncbi:MAG: HAD hydrolase-like protein [Lachnospiraceae bacterium]|jgi:phosphoglycolate phosphatase-like HAD superfamily hydrolase/membrane protease YdiL (CAAX protease family)